MQKIVLAAVVVVVFGLLAFFVPDIFQKMGKDLSDTEKYAERLSSHILDSPNCEQYKAEILKLGKSAQSMNGAFTYAAVQAKEAANKAGCSKPN